MKTRIELLLAGQSASTILPEDQAADVQANWEAVKTSAARGLPVPEGVRLFMTLTSFGGASLTCCLLDVAMMTLTPVEDSGRIEAVTSRLVVPQ